MKKIKFTAHILPHLIAVAVFFMITLFFFSPIFFQNKTLQQHDIQQFMGSSKAIADYRKETGDEALWTNSMFSGMPAYLISVQWGNEAIAYIKKIITLSLPAPVANIFMAFISYYIMLLVFGIRPYLAIAGAIAFGLSSYMIVGLGAGHNGRIGAIASMPLVMAGIHLIFTGKRILGFGVTTVGLALHLRENHLQITYYLLLIVSVYGLLRLIEAARGKQSVSFFKNIALLISAALIAAGTFFGQFWAITEYTQYSIRGPSELTQAGNNSDANGLSRDYAFAYKYGIWEPMTLLIPEFYGGTSANFFVQDRNSETYKALVRSGDNKLANQLAQYTSAYWGPQSFTSAPYYAGAIVVFLFVIGMFFADKSYVWWLVPLSGLSLLLSWGDSFSTFNYFMFDYFPGYNKFRSVNFALVIILFAMPLLGLLGLEGFWQQARNKETRKKLLIALGATGGLCLLLIIFAGMLDFTKDTEGQFPGWFLNALIDDRKSLLRSDAFRSLAFIVAVFVMIYFDVHKKITSIGFYAFLIFMITVDLAVVNKRYFKNESFKHKRDNRFFSMTPADQEILKDKSYYRVYNPREFTSEARTSYFHHSIGGYHGAKLRRYQDYYDSCLFMQTQKFFTQAQQGNTDMTNFGAINMLNIKYIVLGTEQNSIISNKNTNGSAWFVADVVTVNSPAEELQQTCDINTKKTAVIDGSKFTVKNTSDLDDTGTIHLLETKPNYLKYESTSTTDGLAVFSEIYYPGWVAIIDGKESNILRVNYILRALEIPAGKHTISFTFEPKAYTVGNKITTASSWLVVIILLGSIFWSLKYNEELKGLKFKV